MHLSRRPILKIDLINILLLQQQKRFNFSGGPIPPGHRFQLGFHHKSSFRCEKNGYSTHRTSLWLISPLTHKRKTNTFSGWVHWSTFFSCFHECLLENHVTISSRIKDLLHSKFFCHCIFLCCYALKVAGKAA